MLELMRVSYYHISELSKSTFSYVHSCTICLGGNVSDSIVTVLLSTIQSMVEDTARKALQSPSIH